MIKPATLRRPLCVAESGFLAPPNAYKEHRRYLVVEQYMALDHWKDRTIFRDLVTQIKKQIGQFEVSVSLVQKHATHYKFETRLGFKQVPRAVLLDAHSILFEDGLLLEDAAKDWRTSHNPLITGHTSIRFFCGKNLTNGTGINIGVLAVFSSIPRISFPVQKQQQLKKIAASFMQLLDTPYEAIREEANKKHMHQSNTADAELRELSSKLGRATSSGGYMTIFERDGSGTAYSQNHNFSQKIPEINLSLIEGFTKAAIKQDIRSTLRKTLGFRDACHCICRSLATQHQFDFVAILEIRFLELYNKQQLRMPTTGEFTAGSEILPATNSVMTRTGTSSRKPQKKIIATWGNDHGLDQTDINIWHRAFNCSSGLKFESAAGSMYTSGLVMRIHTNKQNLVRKSSGHKRSESEYKVRSGGFLLAAFQESGDLSAITSTNISRIYDHVQIMCKMYLRH